MADASHNFGDDLTVAANGDLLEASGADLTQQRVLRRLFTNPGDYIWQPTYGAGLRQMVGLVANARQIQAVILAQMRQEASVAQSPSPTVTVTNDNAGTVTATIRYTDANDGQTRTIQAPIGS